MSLRIPYRTPHGARGFLNLDAALSRGLLRLYFDESVVGAPSRAKCEVVTATASLERFQLQPETTLLLF